MALSSVLAWWGSYKLNTFNGQKNSLITGNTGKSNFWSGKVTREALLLACHAAVLTGVPLVTGGTGDVPPMCGTHRLV